MHYLNQVFK